MEGWVKNFLGRFYYRRFSWTHILEWCGSIRDALPVIDVVGGLTLLYHRRSEYKSYSYGFQRNMFPQKCFSTKGFSTKCFPQNAGKERCGKIEEASVTHSFCGAYCTATATWYLSGLYDEQYRCLDSYWFKLNFYYENNTKRNKGGSGGFHGRRFLYNPTMKASQTAKK